MKSLAAVVHSVNEEYRFEELELPPLRPDEVLVRMVASGICASDEGLRTGKIHVPMPIVLGHEGAGIVEQVGSAVTHVSVGDQVVLAYAYCRTCTNCRTGNPSSCSSYVALNMQGSRADGSALFIAEDGESVASLSLQGSFSSHSVTTASNVTRVDDEVDLRVIAPLGCGLMTGSGAVAHGLKVETGSTIAVFGTGAVGFGALMTARNEGCSRVIAIDIHESRLDIARELGATDVINSNSEDVVERLAELTGGKGVDHAIDTTGHPAVMRTALDGLAVGGKLAPVSASGAALEVVPVADLIFPRRTIVGVFMGNSVPQVDIPQLVERYKSGTFAVDRLVKFYRFSDIHQAVADSQSGTTIKPVIVLDESYRADAPVHFE